VVLSLSSQVRYHDGVEDDREGAAGVRHGQDVLSVVLNIETGSKDGGDPCCKFVEGR